MKTTAARPPAMPANVVPFPVGRVAAHTSLRRRPRAAAAVGGLAGALGPDARRLRQAVLQWSLASAAPVQPAALTAVIGAKEDQPEELDTWTLDTLEDTCGAALLPWLTGAEHLVTAATIAQALLATLRYQVEQGLGPDSDAVSDLVAATARLGLTTMARQRSSRPTG